MPVDKIKSNENAFAIKNGFLNTPQKKETLNLFFAGHNDKNASPSKLIMHDFLVTKIETSQSSVQKLALKIGLFCYNLLGLRHIDRTYTTFTLRQQIAHVLSNTASDINQYANLSRKIPLAEYRLNQFFSSAEDTKKQQENIETNKTTLENLKPKFQKAIEDFSQGVLENSQFFGSFEEKISFAQDMIHQLLSTNETNEGIEQELEIVAVMDNLLDKFIDEAAQPLAEHASQKHPQKAVKKLEEFEDNNLGDEIKKYTDGFASLLQIGKDDSYQLFKRNIADAAITKIRSSRESMTVLDF